MNPPRTAFVSVCLLLVAASSSRAAQPAAGRAIRRSDVVFMYDNPEMYEPYGCTVLGWAGRADRDHIRQAHEMGVRQFSVGVGFLTEFRRVIDFSDDFLDAAARNFAGKPFIVPWLWDHKYKGQPAYWWCTNSPLYRQYLDSRLRQQISAGPDGLHIDDYRGTSGSVTWLSGCFCRHCMKAFRQYLGREVPAEKLAQLGITDLKDFDYRQFLLGRGVTPEQYKKRRRSLPLAKEFYDFQVKANTAFVAQYRRRAEQIRGKPLALCVNSGLTNPQSLAIAPQLSYFCCEVRHGAASLKPAEHPIYVYKLGDGLDRPVASTASGQDWAYVAEHHKPALVRSWAALSYAFGHTLMAPHRQWCYTKEKGTHWYAGPTDQYAYLYRFVRGIADLLDGHQAIAPVAVVYDNAARRLGRGNIEPICIRLAQQNVPFTVLIAGDDWLDYHLTAGQLKPYRAVVVPQGLAMDDPQRQLLKAVEAQGRLVRWPDEEGLRKRVGTPVAVQGASDVMVVSRAIPGDTQAPVVVHLLNRRYDGANDRIVPGEGFAVRIRRDLLGGRTFSRATLHAPKAEPRPLSLTVEGETLVIHVPRLDLWGVVALEP